MKLYTFDAAPNPARLGMFMQYKGISLDTVQIDLGAEEQLGEAYRAIVPEATVPALVLDDSTVLCSVIAIAHYLGPESFTLFTFAYRSLAGLIFAFLFLFRGFAVAVYTHCLYDVYVLTFS